jgi:glycosyl transferase family 2
MISVVTPTYQNWPSLQRAIASLDAQSFTDWQHVVVADGPDPELRERMHDLGYAGHGKRVFVELGRNWHGFLGGDNGAQPPDRPGARGGRGSRGAEVGLIATHLAAGEYVTYLDADCEYGEHHLKLHADALAATGADFTFSRMRRLLDGRFWDLVGDGTPAYGRIDGNVVVHKAELLVVANWRWGGDADWDLIGRWVESGARWEWVPEITVHWHHSGGDI